MAGLVFNCNPQIKSTHKRRAREVDEKVRKDEGIRVYDLMSGVLLVFEQW